MRKRTRFVAGVLIGLSFGVGGLAGMAIEESLGLDWFDFLDEDEPEDSILAGLDLSDEQREQAERILDRQEDRLEDYWEGRLPELRAILRESNAELRQILTPEQQRVFDRSVRELGDRVPDEVRD